MDMPEGDSNSMHVLLAALHRAGQDCRDVGFDEEADRLAYIGRRLARFTISLPMPSEINPQWIEFPERSDTCG